MRERGERERRERERERERGDTKLLSCTRKLSYQQGNKCITRSYAEAELAVMRFSFSV